MIHMSASETSQHPSPADGLGCENAAENASMDGNILTKQHSYRKPVVWTWLKVICRATTT